MSKRLSEILLAHGADAGELTFSLEKAIISWVSDEVIGWDDDVSMKINPASDEDLIITLGENANNRLRAEQRKRLQLDNLESE